MTHTIHRNFSDEQYEDYVIIVSSTVGFNSDESARKLRLLVDKIDSETKLLSFGNPKAESTIQKTKEEVMEGIVDGARIHMVFSDISNTEKAIQIIKEMDLGFSVCISGNSQEIKRIALQYGLCLESIQIDLGIHGKKEQRDQASYIISLCGHMRVSPYLYYHVLGKVKSGEMTAQNSAEKLGKTCKCGCFDVSLVSEIIYKEAFQ